MSIYAEYERLLGQVIDRVKTQGEKPTAALLKVAQAEKLTPPRIEYLAGQFNNSRTLVHVFKSADAEKQADFDLADASEVIKHLAACDKAESPAPKKKGAGSSVFAKKVAPTAAVTHKASAEKPAQQDFLGLMLAGDAEEDACRGILLKLHTAYSQEAELAARETAGLLRTVGSDVGRLSVKDRERFGRRVVNRFGTFGEHITRSVYHAAGVEDAVPARTAGESTFPAQALYARTGKLMDGLNKVRMLRNTANAVKHCADGFAEDFLANSAALMAMTPSMRNTQTGIGLQRMGELRTADKVDEVKGEMSLAASARLNGLRTRRAFFNVVMDDPHLRGYPLGQLSEAFNNVVQNEPQIVQNPTALRAYMLQTIQSPVLDPFALGQMIDTGKKRLSITKDLAAQKEGIHKATQTYMGNVNVYRDKVQKAKEDADAKAEEIRNKERDAKSQWRSSQWKKMRDSIGMPAEASSIFGGIQKIRDESLRRNTAIKEVNNYLSGMSTDAIDEAVREGGYSSSEAMKQDMLKTAIDPKLATPSAISNAPTPLVRALKKAEEHKQSDKTVAQTMPLVDKFLAGMDPALKAQMLASGNFASEDAYKASIVKSIREGNIPKEIQGELRTDMQDAMKAYTVGKQEADTRATEMDAAAQLAAEMGPQVDAFVDNMDPAIMAQTLAGGKFSSPDEFRDYIMASIASGTIPSEVRGELRNEMQNAMGAYKKSTEAAAKTAAEAAAEAKRQSTVGAALNEKQFKNLFEYDPADPADIIAMDAFKAITNKDLAGIQADVSNAFSLTGTSKDRDTLKARASLYDNLRKATAQAGALARAQKLGATSRATLMKALTPELRPRLKQGQVDQANKILRRNDLEVVDDISNQIYARMDPVQAKGLQAELAGTPFGTLPIADIMAAMVVKNQPTALVAEAFPDLYAAAGQDAGVLAKALHDLDVAVRAPRSQAKDVYNGLYKYQTQMLGTNDKPTPEGALFFKSV